MPPASIEIDAEQGGVADLTDIEARKKKHIEWFKKTYSKEIAYMKEMFGNMNAVVKWGVVNYWS